MTTQNIKIPVWFWIVAVVFLLWNLMGVNSFFQHTFISEEALQALPQDQRELYETYPLWATIVFAIAVFGGVLGCLGLLFRKKWARPFFILSLVAVVIQMFYYLFMTKSIEVYGTRAVTMPIMVIVIAVFLIWLASYGIKKGWLK